MFSEIALEVGVAAGVAVAAPFVYEGLFRNPPSPPARTYQQGAASVCGIALIVAAILFLV